MLEKHRIEPLMQRVLHATSRWLSAGYNACCVTRENSETLAGWSTLIATLCNGRAAPTFSNNVAKRPSAVGLERTGKPLE